MSGDDIHILDYMHWNDIVVREGGKQWIILPFSHNFRCNKFSGLRSIRSEPCGTHHTHDYVRKHCEREITNAKLTETEILRVEMSRD
jgi:hypothetical protein